MRFRRLVMVACLTTGAVAPGATSHASDVHSVTCHVTVDNAYRPFPYTVSGTGYATCLIATADIGGVPSSYAGPVSVFFYGGDFGCVEWGVFITFSHEGQSYVFDTDLAAGLGTRGVGAGVGAYINDQWHSGPTALTLHDFDHFSTTYCFGGPSEDLPGPVNMTLEAPVLVPVL